jgi:putative transposase
MKRKVFLRLRERYRRRGLSFVYLDESGFELETTRQYARASRGQKVHGKRSGHKHPRTSLIAARMGQLFEAPVLFRGNCNTEFFNAWLENELCPLLNEKHVVVMDNVSFHKGIKTKELIQKTGAKILFLPPYSPDFNPIEQDFATLKKIREYNEYETLENIVKNYN